MLQFPFWIVTPRRSLSSFQEIGCKESATVRTFSNAKQMGEFMAGQNMTQDGRLEIKLVNRYLAKSIFQELLQAGWIVVEHDPSPDGSGGTPIPIADIMAMISD